MVFTVFCLHQSMEHNSETKKDEQLLVSRTHCLDIILIPIKLHEISKMFTGLWGVHELLEIIIKWA